MNVWRSVHHMPHFVSTRKPGAPTRWGHLFAYHTVDERAVPSEWAPPVPPHWARRCLEQGVLSARALDVLRGDVPPPSQADCLV